MVLVVHFAGTVPNVLLQSTYLSENLRSLVEERCQSIRCLHMFILPFPIPPILAKELWKLS